MHINIYVDVNTDVYALVDASLYATVASESVHESLSTTSASLLPTVPDPSASSSDGFSFERLVAPFELHAWSGHVRTHVCTCVEDVLSTASMPVGMAQLSDMLHGFICACMQTWQASVCIDMCTDIGAEI